MGSFYAKSKGLRYDDPQKGLAGIDKSVFREHENSTNLPHWYKKPLFLKVNSFEEARDFIKKADRKLFIKPTCEGNSRGCFAVESINDLESYKEILEKYWLDGVIIEEYIQDCHEYSFESIDDFQVITEKKTTEGRFRVEIQHILPAPLTVCAYARLILAGKEVGKIVGSNNGAEHNELFLHSQGHVYCVEPNRRPAGMKIWDMIKVAFDFDMYKAWLNWACNGEIATNYPVQNKYFVGYRMLRARKSGTLENYEIEIEHLKQYIVELQINKVKGAKVTNTLRDNSDGIGHVIVKHEDISQLYLLLDEIEDYVASKLSIS
jgi:biotin carboxylase